MSNLILHEVLSSLLPRDCSIITEVVHDHRKASKNSLFIAIPGQNLDSRKFTKDIIDLGAYIVCDLLESKFGLPEELIDNKDDKKVIIVDNINDFINEFLEKLCVELKANGTQIICITGTSGKTSTKLWMTQTLQNYFGDLYVTKDAYTNYNSGTIGLLIFACDSCSKNNPRALIFEVGISQAGDIDQMCRIVRPNISIVTNVGYAHIGNFGGENPRLSLIKEKLSLFDFTSDLCIVNHDLLQYIKPEILSKVKSFGTQESDATITQNNDSYKVSGSIKTSHNKYQITFEHIKQNQALYNAAATILAFEHLYSKDVPGLITELEKLSSSKGRGEFHKDIQLFLHDKSKTIDLIDSSYNANGGPNGSMQKELESLEKISKNGHKVGAVLGEMNENAAFSKELHADILKYALTFIDIKNLFLIGNAWRSLEGDVSIFSYPELNSDNIDIAFSSIFDMITDNMTVLVKGSNGVGLYKYLMPRLTKGNQ